MFRILRNYTLRASILPNITEAIRFRKVFLDNFFIMSYVFVQRTLVLLIKPYDGNELPRGKSYG
jgi:hypothetical protein